MQVPGGLPSAHLLYEQQSFIDRVLFHPTFQWSVRTLRQTQMVSVPHVQPVAKAASIFDQHSPVGASRIVAQPEHFSKHIDDAVNKARFPPSRAWKKAPPDLQAAVSLVSSYHSQPDALLARRKVVRGVVDEVVRVLQPLSSRLAAYSPEHVRALPTSINIAFVAALVVAQQWSDPLLPAKLLFGSPVVGDFPASGAFRPNVQWAKKSASKVNLFAWVEDLHSKIAERGRRSSKKAAHDARQVLRKTMEEVDGPPPQGGWVEGPFTKSDMYIRFPAGFWPSRRFGVLQKGVIRPCDDCKESWINLCSTMRESISPDAADFPAHIASLFYSVLGRKARLSGGCDDWKKAYRQIPVDDPSRSVVACWDPDSKSVVYFVVRGHVFGAVHAVNSFNAVSKFLTVSCRSLFACCGGNYFDDHVMVEPDFAGGSAQQGLACVANACGFIFDPDKHVDMARRFVYLGVQNDFSRVPDGFSILRILPERQDALVDACRGFLKSGSMSHGQAASLRGKLYFAATSAYGKVGRAALQPILQRQDSKGRSATRLTPAMILSLKFFITLLHHMPDREIFLDGARRAPLLVWSDASWERGVGWLGFVVYDPEQSRFFYSDSEVPSHILKFFVLKKQKIGQCEILAAAMVYTSMPDVFRGREAIHWIDNTSAISCLLHGYSGKLDSALMVNAFHLYNAGLKVRVHFEYVESKANVADLPSRQEFTYLLLSLAAKRVPTFIHPAGTWSGPLKRFLLDASSGEEGVPERPRSTRARSRSRRPGHQR